MKFCEKYIERKFKKKKNELGMKREETIFAITFFKFSFTYKIEIV